MHTVDTKASKIPNLRVHIAPVGYEIDRIILPAREMRADKVVLLVHDKPNEDRAVQFYEKISLALEESGVEVTKEYHDRLDLFGIIRTVRDLIRQEDGNIISVNLASGSKIQAVGCMMACMMFNDRKNVAPFYVEAEEYLGFSGDPISRGIKDIEYIPAYEIQRPPKRHLEALRMIHRQGGRISKKEMAKMAVEGGLITVNAANASQATFASLDKNIISPLENQWNFVTVEKIGRTRWIKITEEGRHATEFLI